VAAEKMHRALTNFYWHGAEGVDVDPRWFYIEDEVPESVAAAVGAINTDRERTEAAEPEPDLGPPVPPPSQQGDSITVTNPTPQAPADTVAAALAAPATVEESGSAVVVPPRSGPGSGRDAWAAYADALGVQYGDGDKRDDIIELIELEDHPVDRPE
jgi:hypothetical protein